MVRFAEHVRGIKDGWEQARRVECSFRCDVSVRVSSERIRVASGNAAFQITHVADFTEPDLSALAERLRMNGERAVPWVVTVFAHVYNTLTIAQKTKLAALRKSILSGTDWRLKPVQIMANEFARRGCPATRYSIADGTPGLRLLASKAASSRWTLSLSPAGVADGLGVRHGDCLRRPSEHRQRLPDGHLPAIGPVRKAVLPAKGAHEWTDGWIVNVADAGQ